jgi:hypothetical protein
VVAVWLHVSPMQCCCQTRGRRLGWTKSDGVQCLSLLSCCCCCVCVCVLQSQLASSMWTTSNFYHLLPWSCVVLESVPEAEVCKAWHSDSLPCMHFEHHIELCAVSEHARPVACLQRWERLCATVS